MMTRRLRLSLLLGGVLILSVLLFVWRPTVIIYGIQRAGLYAAIAMPMGLILGIVHIVNLAHGELMMLAAYFTYFFCVKSGLSPFIAMIPVTIVMVLLGMIVYRLTIRRTLKAPELNQLILTFGLAMILSQTVNLIATSQPRKLSLSYVSASANIGETSFGTYDFIYTVAAVLILVGLQLFMKRTRLGKAAIAVGQNPTGARLIGINVDRTYLVIFSVAVGLVGIMGTLFMTRSSIFPLVGGAYTMKSFCLVAMAGIGNIPAILICSLGLGVAESFIASFRGVSGWSQIVFFALIIIVIMYRSLKWRRA